MAETIEFKKFTATLDSNPLTISIRSVSIDPAEFDAVARERGWVKPNQRLTIEDATTAACGDWVRESEHERVLGELKAATSHTCLIDGVTYRGNEETIDALEYWHNGHELAVAGHTEAMNEISDLKRRSAEAQKRLGEANEEANEKLAAANSELQTLKSSPSIPDKWRKAIPDAVSGHVYQGGDLVSMVACCAVNAMNRNDECTGRQRARVAAIRSLDWLAAELEKGG